MFSLSTCEGEQPENLAIYRAVSDPSAIGIGPNSEVVCGIRLERVHVQGFDCLAEDISNAGADAIINLPEQGLTPGQLYQPRVTGTQRDHEGYLDYWEITLYPYDGEIPACSP